MAVGFGLLAALLWGLTDFLISLSGRAFGVHRAMLYAQGVGVVALGLALPFWIAGLPDAPTARGWSAAIIAAPIGVLATLSLYRGLKTGQVSVVAPITATFGAVTALLSLVTGERVAGTVLAGIGLVVVGAVLLGTQRSVEGRRPAKGAVGWAVFASLAYGVQFWLQGRFAVPELGSVLPVWIYYLTSTALLALAAPLLRQSLALPWPGVAQVAGTGAVAVAGFVALSLGLGTGQVAVVTVLASLQSGITVCLACLYHRERLAPHQWLGLLTTLMGLAAVHLG